GGWYRDSQNSYAFDVTAAADSAAAKAGAGLADIGAITASFFVAWDPLTEERPAAETGAARKSVGTGKGPLKTVSYQDSARLFGESVRATISVRYSRVPGQNIAKQDLIPAAGR